MPVETTEARDLLTEKVIGGAIEVHRILGPGLLESAYRRCLTFELRKRGLAVELVNFHQTRLVDGLKRFIL